MNRFRLPTLSILAVALTLPACGGGDSSDDSGAADRSEAREAALDFAQCMRENGVDMPDPGPDGGIRLRAGPDGDNDPATLTRAQEACEKHLEDVRPPEMSEQQQREFRERALKFARCMREQGIDMPDPTFGGQGRVQQRLGEGIDPEDPRFREATEACSEYQPRIRREGGA